MSRWSSRGETMEATGVAGAPGASHRGNAGGGVQGDLGESVTVTGKGSIFAFTSAPAVSGEEDWARGAATQSLGCPGLSRLPIAKGTRPAERSAGPTDARFLIHIEPRPSQRVFQPQEPEYGRCPVPHLPRDFRLVMAHHFTRLHAPSTECAASCPQVIGSAVGIWRSLRGCPGGQRWFRLDPLRPHEIAPQEAQDVAVS